MPSAILLNYFPFLKKGIILALAEIREKFRLPINCLCESPTAISFFEVGR